MLWGAPLNPLGGVCYFKWHIDGDRAFHHPSMRPQELYLFPMTSKWLWEPFVLQLFQHTLPWPRDAMAIYIFHITWTLSTSLFNFIFALKVREFTTPFPAWSVMFVMLQKILLCQRTTLTLIACTFRLMLFSLYIDLTYSLFFPLFRLCNSLS